MSNDTKDITEISPENELDTLQDIESTFIDEYLNCLDVREAGKRSGYSESTINSGYLYRKFQNPNFQEKFRKAVIARDYEDLAYGYLLERKGLRKALEQAKENPESAITNLGKLKHILKQKKQIAGVLSQDAPKPQPATFNLTALRMIHNDLMPSNPNEPKTIEIEVITEK